MIPNKKKFNDFQGKYYASNTSSPHCVRCSRIFSSSSKMRKYVLMQQAVQNKEFFITNGVLIIKDNLVIMYVLILQKGNYCDFCAVRFKNYYNLVEHLNELVCSRYKFIYDVCKKTFICMSSLITHL